MNIQDILMPSLVICQHASTSKKRVLDDIAEKVNQTFSEINSSELLRNFIAREKLGSTGIGGGIAIPHCRVKECNSTIGILLTLESPIDFDAIDNQPVDVIFALLIPDSSDNNDEHLQTLSHIAELFTDSKTLTNVRAASNNSELLSAIKH